MTIPWRDFQIGRARKRFQARLLHLDFGIQLLALRLFLKTGDDAAIRRALEECEAKADRLYKQHLIALQVLESIANSDTLLNGDTTSQEAHGFCVLSARQFLKDLQTTTASEAPPSREPPANVTHLPAPPRREG